MKIYLKKIALLLLCTLTVQPLSSFIIEEEVDFRTASPDKLSFILAGAIRRGDDAIVKECLVKKVNVNQIWQGKTTPLLYAILKLKQIFSDETSISENAGYGIVTSGGAGAIVFCCLRYLWQIDKNQKLEEGKDQKTNLATILGKFLDLYYEPKTRSTNGIECLGYFLKALCVTGVSLGFVNASFGYFKTAGVEFYRRNLKGSGRIIIVDKLIDHLDTNLELEVHGVTALSMIRGMIATEKSYAFKNTLRGFERRIINRINKQRQETSTPQAPTSDEQPASQENIKTCQNYTTLFEKEF